MEEENKRKKQQLAIMVGMGVVVVMVAVGLRVVVIGLVNWSRDTMHCYLTKMWINFFFNVDYFS